MSEREPITAELRELLADVNWTEIESHGLDGWLDAWRAEFDRICDAIDAVHAALERENAELRERVAELDKRGESMHDGRRITDELRAWWVRKFPVMDKELHEDFTAIADRIDAEHQKAIRELNNLADGCVLLPVDADGEYIHAGDVLDGYGKTIEVVEMRYGRSGWVLISRDGNGYVDTFAFSHYHAPTVEDVLTKFGIDWEYEDNCEDRAALLAEYASKLRLAGDAETCRQEERGWTTEGDHARVFLTCGHDCMVETVADLPNFCPVCGARVEVGE